MEAFCSSLVVLPGARLRYDPSLPLIRYTRLGAAAFLRLPTILQTYMQVYASFVGGDGLKSQYDWLVLFIFMIGTYVFTMGCTLLYVDANNTEYPGKMTAWKASGRQGKRPRSACQTLTLM